MFDRVECGYLFQALHKCGLGVQFINWVKLLYVNPRATVFTNGKMSSSFPPEPADFHISTRTIGIRNNVNIKGIQAGKRI